MKKYIPPILVVLFGLYILSSLRTPEASSQFDITTLGRIPVLHGGRIKPIDTVARTSLLILSGKQTLKLEDGERKTATEWLLDMLFAPEKADKYKVFEIDDPDVLGLFGIQQTEQRLYSFAVLQSRLNEIDEQASSAEKTPEGQRSRFQNAVRNLRDRVLLYERLETIFRIGVPGHIGMPGHTVEGLKSFNEKAESIIQKHNKDSNPSDEAAKELQGIFNQYRMLAEFSEFMPLTPLEASASDNDWINVGVAFLNRFQSGAMHPDMQSWAEMADAYNQGSPPAFNKALGQYYAKLESQVPSQKLQSRYETIFNYFEPFYKSMIVYVVVLLLACAFWLTQSKVLNTSAFALLILAFTIHTAGLFARVILQGRPPVTNLYSSAIFVGWGAVLLGIVMEKMFKNGVGNVVSAAIGFTTLIIAHHLALQGDTMEMMRAVLDSNFWLATHVVCITIGYSSTFLSGTMAIVYLVRRVVDSRFDDEAASSLNRMVYGIICFSTIFSFVGTVLGGIWADQSWGRFWGWDPKENGALLIVLWNVLILHVRRGRNYSDATIMMMAVFGNVVTALSWFGVNMLGIGLHSYGFMEKAFVWLVIFTISQLAIMGLGFLPARRKALASVHTVS